MRKVDILNKKIKLSDEILGFIEKKVTAFGTGAKVDCPREFIGKRVYLVICKD